MTRNSSPAQAGRSVAKWMALAVLAPLGLLIVCGWMLLELRQDAWEKSEQSSQNLLQMIERDIDRNFEIYGLSVQAVMDNLRKPGLSDLTPEMRHLVLFDRAATAKDMGNLAVYDETGRVIVDSGSIEPRKINYADRPYFQAHMRSPDTGLHVSAPLISRMSGERILVLSRRIDKPDGSFGGVAVGTWHLSYFRSLFDRLNLGQHGAINLFHEDGTRIMRMPYDEADIGVSLAGTPTFSRFLRDGSGSFIGQSSRDGVRRHYAFKRVGTLPLILDVATEVEWIEAEWRGKAIVISLVMLALAGLTVVLSFLFGRELRARASAEREARTLNAELSRLTMTDTLTGLHNRRHFDETLEREWKMARRAGTDIALLVVDADHFKRYNDRYGHQVGDEILKGLAVALSESIHRPADKVFRVGGEEFVFVLPETDAAGADRIAARVHAKVAHLTVASAGIAAGSVTVSIGVATCQPRSGGETSELYSAADAALYEAKSTGRNRTVAALPRPVAVEA